MNPRSSLNLRKILFVAMLGMIVMAAVLAFNRSGPWVIPEEAKRRVNPIKPSPAALDSARGIYRDRCAHCHGDTGNGDGPDAQKHSTKPTDFTDAGQENVRTDGELFYQITEGHRPMPAYKSRLSEEQRWQLVLLIRSFSTQPPGGKK
jgi:mono/diheme cytochrome c family protein